MAQSLNQYASRIAHIVGQSDNQSLKERVKDMIKDYFAKYLIQSIDRNGVQPYYKLSLILDMVVVDETKIVNPLWTEDNNLSHYIYIDFKTNSKVPTPLNFKNDSPFTRVCIPHTSKLFAYTSPTLHRIALTLVPTRSLRVYSYENNIITVRRNIPFNGFVSTEDITKIEVESIWENPEEIIGFYSIEDNQDLPLPFPNEMISFIIAELLKVEFGIKPTDEEITKE